MLVCKECGAVFSKEDTATVHDHVGYCGSAPAYVYRAVCPECGCDDLAEAVECDMCGEYFDPDEMYKVENYCACRGCKEALIVAYKAYRDYVSEHPHETINPFEMLSTSAEREILAKLRMDGEINDEKL